MIILALACWLGFTAVAVLVCYWVAAAILRPRKFPADNIERDIANGDPRLTDLLNTRIHSGSIIEGEQ